MIVKERKSLSRSLSPLHHNEPYLKNKILWKQKSYSFKVSCPHFKWYHILCVLTITILIKIFQPTFPYKLSPIEGERGQQPTRLEVSCSDWSLLHKQSVLLTSSHTMIVWATVTASFSSSSWTSSFLAGSPKKALLLTNPSPRYEPWAWGEPSWIGEHDDLGRIDDWRRLSSRACLFLVVR